MYLSQRATSNSTIQGIITLATSQGGGDQSRNAIEVVFEFLGICLRWTARQVYRAIAALLRGLKVPELLDFIFRALFQILKWCSIGLAIAVGVPVTIQVGYWGVQKLLQMRHERRMKQHNEILRKEQEEFHEADMRERQARRKAERLREEEERQRRERENEAIKAKLKREEEQRLKEAREIFMMWDKECALVLCNKASMAKFPFPPLPRCTVPGCPMLTKTAACKHNVRQFFEGSGELSFQLLKRHRHLWHEDRFASCREELRKEFRRLANSLFVALDPLYEEFKAKETNHSTGR